MITRQRALDAIAHEKHLAEIYQLEPNRIEAILDTALKYGSAETRWECYEALKRFSSQFVGRDARSPELRTSAHYEVMLAFLDWLLPVALEVEA
jgi:hypothetical protein